MSGERSRGRFRTARAVLEVPPKGQGRWRYKYRFGGKEKRVSLGTYPDVSLREARERHQEMQKLHARGEDPSVEKKAKKAKEEAEGETFESVAREWWKSSRSQTSFFRLVFRLAG